jgi:hypothetical protein
VRTANGTMRCDFCGLPSGSLSVVDYSFRWNRSKIWTGEACDDCLEHPQTGITYHFEEDSDATATDSLS